MSTSLESEADVVVSTQELENERSPQNGQQPADLDLAVQDEPPITTTTWYIGFSPG